MDKDRKLKAGYSLASILTTDGIGLPVVYSLTGNVWSPRHMAPDSCFEPAAPEPSIRDQLAEKGKAVAAEIERRQKAGQRVCVRVVANPVSQLGAPDTPDSEVARAVGFVVQQPGGVGTWMVCNVCFPGRPEAIWCHNLDVLSDDEVLALLNKGARHDD